MILFVSRGLLKLEKNYFVYKFEFFVLKWVVVDKFYDYLYGNIFIVLMDNNFLIYVLFFVILDVIGYRWLVVLGIYDFDIKYRLGIYNKDVDILFRMLMFIDVVKFVCNKINIVYLESFGVLEIVELL